MKPDMSQKELFDFSRDLAASALRGLRGWEGPTAVELQARRNANPEPLPDIRTTREAIGDFLTKQKPRHEGPPT